MTCTSLSRFYLPKGLAKLGCAMREGATYTDEVTLAHATSQVIMRQERIYHIEMLRDKCAPLLGVGAEESMTQARGL